MVEIAGHIGIGKYRSRLLNHLSLMVSPGKVRENKAADIRLNSQASGLAGRQVTELPGHLSIFIQVSGLDRKRIGISANLD